MKRFASAIALCVSLLVFGLFVLLPKTQAEKNLLQNLLDLPAPPPPNPLAINGRHNFSEDFFDKSKPPEDDAAIEDLLTYWQNQSESYAELGYNIKPSEKTLQRIFGEIEQNPEKLASFLNVLPENSATADFVKRFYDQEIADQKFGDDWDAEVKGWLTYHSNYFTGDLAKVAERTGDADGYLTNQSELLALTRIDWDRAQPIIERLYNDNSQPVSQVLARWALYRHALDTDSTGDIERYRDELKATIENKSATPGMRDLAMDSLVKEKEWQGRDDWYLSLLGDETLADLRVNGQYYTGLTTLVLTSAPEKYLDKMLELLKNGNPAIRGAAIRNLAIALNEKKPEVVRALLPWLEDANWAKETNGERRNLINALQKIKMPESVPGLIAVLNEKQIRDVSPFVGNVSVNANVSVKTNGEPTEFYPYRDEAVLALITQKDLRAATALRLILPQVEEWQRGNVVRALVASRGFTVTEEVEALESVAKNHNQPAQIEMTNNAVTMSNTRVIRETPTVEPMYSANMMSNASVNAYPDDIANRPYNPSDLKPLLAIQLINQPDPDEDLVTALIDRINFLDTKDPSLAFGLRQIMKNWRGAAINAMLLRDLKTDKTDADSVVKLLSLRKELRENQSNEVFDARGGTPTALGISACLLEDANGYDQILQGENAEAKTAMLACARLIRARLSVRKVAENLRNSNALLALAAERYLESEDSAEARTIVLSLHPNEAKILGATAYFVADNGFIPNNFFLQALFSSVDESLANVVFYDSADDVKAVEKKLQKEVKENQELLGVYAYDKNYIRIYKDKAVFSWEEDPARYRERDLKPEEFGNIKSYLAAERASDLAPFLSDCGGEDDCAGKELLMLGRQGGRRVFVKGGSQPKFFAELDKMFADMRQPPAKLHYWLERNLKGLEILFEDERLQAEAVWKTGDDFRILVNDQDRRKQIDKELNKQDTADDEKADADSDYEKIEAAKQKRREQRAFENYAWHKFADGKFAELTDQPAQIEFLPKQTGIPIRTNEHQWKARAANVEVQASDDGLYKIARGQTVKLRDGYYGKPVVTPNGRWAIATKYGEEEAPRLVRINLLTNKQFKINADDYPIFETVAFVPSLNRVLIFGGGYQEYETEDDDMSQRNGEYFLLDAETGVMQKVKGEIRPLAQQTYHPLQTTGAVDEFWAAIPDAEKNETQVGVYNAKTLSFKSMLKIPQITFNSMKMWVDANKVYFVYQGHLLALPLQK
ncbi:MAG: HEAT repeat domain-containing protein [Pyrinomonadaceae bacterium]